ncbi:MAG: hypothetical protein KF745_10190 [Phycisphaeraceae bacterium]|nr:hypothetical protein [Phycisphaeraceae bacterium]
MPDPKPIPPQSTCPDCDYDLSGLAPDHCPECGAAVNDESRAVTAYRLETVGQARSCIVMFISVLLVVPFCYALGATLSVRESGVAPVVIVILSTILVGSLIPIAIAASFVRPSLRAFLWAFWLQHIWKLHAPWLVAPMIMAILLVVVAVLHWLGEPRGTAELLLPFGAIPWVVGAVAMAARWRSAWAQARCSGRFNQPTAAAVVSIGGYLTYVAALLLGMPAALMAAYGAMRLVYPRFPY